MRKPSQNADYLRALAHRQTTTEAELRDQKQKSDAVIAAGGRVNNFENRHMRRVMASQARKGITPADFIYSLGGVV